MLPHRPARTGGLKQYAHLGTDNYNPKTAKGYTDVSLFTCQKTITEEVALLFNTLTGVASTPELKTLLVAPFNLHSKIQEKIIRETKNAKAGHPAEIFVKVNSLIDQDTINNLYEASQAGVNIHLIVRGICGLVPRVPGLSENIEVRSILGRFLEHNRIYYFKNSTATSELYASSADWMPRNFYRRIECVFPILDLELKNQVIKDWIPALIHDSKYSKSLTSNGSYKASPHKEAFCAQEHFMNKASETTLNSS